MLQALTFLPSTSPYFRSATVKPLEGTCDTVTHTGCTLQDTVDENSKQHAQGEASGSEQHLPPILVTLRHLGPIMPQNPCPCPPPKYSLNEPYR